MQTVSDDFHAAAEGSIIPLAWALRIAFTKEFDDDVTFFTLDQSVLDGPDVLAPTDEQPIQLWDKYEYDDFSDRVIDMEWSREIQFPYSVQAALADVVLDNHDNYFTPNSSSPLSDYILPKRPIRIFAGYQNAETVQQIVGVTQGMPEISDLERTASFHILDFLSEMFNMQLTDTIAAQDIRTDEVLALMFEQFGLEPSAYSLARGSNTIPFLFFEQGKNAGEAFNELMLTEGGKLWLDEQGIIRFDRRLTLLTAPVTEIGTNKIVSIGVIEDDNIINTVRIKSNVRKVQDFQPIYTNARPESEAPTLDANVFTVSASGSAFYPYAALSDPALNATTPTLGRKTDTSWFSAYDGNGDLVSSGVSVSFSQLNQNNYTMQFTNANAYDVYIDQVEVWGQPAKVVDRINYQAYDPDSVEKFGERVFESPESEFFGSVSNCDSFAEWIIDAYKDYGGKIEMTIKGDYSLQLSDIVDVDYSNYTGTYRLTRADARLSDGTQRVEAERYRQRNWFVLDVSELDSAAVLAP